MAIKEGCWLLAGRKLVLLLVGLIFGLALPTYSQTKILSFGEIVATSAEGQPEYFTLVNNTDKDINLAGWLLADLAKKDKPLSLDGYTIPAQTTLKFLAKDLGLTLNNDTEALFLWQPTGGLVDTIEHITSSNKTTKATSQNETIQGVVTALPSQLSSQYFYITYGDNSAGLKIYNYHRLWPELRLGSLIAVTGQLVTTTLETKLSIDGPQDIKVLSQESQLQPLNAAKNWANLKNGQLLELTGQLSAKNQSTLYLTDDQGEYLVQIKTGSQLKSTDFTVGQNYRITGLAIDNNGYRLIPRQKEDIVLLETTDNSSTVATTTLDFSQEKSTNKSWPLWLFGTLAGLTIALVAYRLAK
ncbi:MAG TPA: lamin tail domain-containing protein [bacterium]|nr:lamin tail domain-containing protein [bacterium]